MRTVLVTGGTSTLGRSICKAFVEIGCEVVCTYAHHKEKAENLQKELGPLLHIEELDVLSPTSVETFFSRLDTLDVLVNNSGVFTLSDQEDLNIEDWEKVFNTNVRGLFLVTQQAIPLLKRSSKGCIVNIASINALHPGFGMTAHYDASKGAVVSYTKSLAAELGPKIRVNAVAPGLLDAPYLHEQGNFVKEMFVQRAVLKQLVSPDSVASCVVFLSTNPAITGEVITVDCGYLVG